ncbi:hypothetical protein QQ045_028165 [Rhodiola kirilowii]
MCTLSNPFLVVVALWKPIKLKNNAQNGSQLRPSTKCSSGHPSLMVRKFITIKDHFLTTLRWSFIRFHMSNLMTWYLNFGSKKQITSGEFQHLRQSFASPKVLKPQRQTGNISQTTSMNKMMIRLADSLLIMKSSSDPRREFRDSMMEMISENKIKDGKDLEKLLACYLMLNSAAYHDVIIQVFKQIWVELIQT